MNALKVVRNIVLGALIVVAVFVVLLLEQHFTGCAPSGPGGC